MEIKANPINCKLSENLNVNFDFIQEGKVKIAIDKDAQTFYNPVQEFNRDLTILVLQQFIDDRSQDFNFNNNDLEPPSSKQLKINFLKPSAKIRILDALSASGLRALRFAKELSNIDFVIANDFSENAVAAIRQNVKLNNVEDLVQPSFGDAIDVMMAHRSYDKRFHAIDLDPYGSAAIFLDSAVQSVVDGGLLMVTCTDTATLCGNTPEACYNKYGSIPLRHRCCHEFALRILLKCIDSHAARHGRYILPLLSVSIDFYIRCFVQIFTSSKIAKNCVTKLSNVLVCSCCKSFEFQPLIRKTTNGTSVRFTASTIQTKITNSSTIMTSKNNNKDELENQREEIDSNLIEKTQCFYCGNGPIHLSGPIWTNQLHNVNFVNKLLQRLNSMVKLKCFNTHERLLGLLTVVSEEVQDSPLYYESDQLMNVVRCPAPKHSIFCSAILNAGYNCSISHCNPKAIKTNAPILFLWDVCKAWAKESKVEIEKVKNYPTAYNILSSKIAKNINFAFNPYSISKSKANCLLRFPDNKGKNWGPKRKAKNLITSQKNDI